MKHVFPSRPANAPDGTASIGGPISWFSVSLNVTDKDLDPAVVTEIFGISPTQHQSRGLSRFKRDGSCSAPARFGRWSFQISPAELDEWDLNEVIKRVLEIFPGDLAVWQKIRALGEIKLSLGLSLKEDGREFLLEADLLRDLGEKGIAVWFDIYREDQS